MSRSLPTQIEDALELLLYAERYRDSLLTLVLEPGLPFRSVVDALRVFELAHIRCVVFCQKHAALAEELATLSRRGMQLSLEEPVENDTLHLGIKEDIIPVCAIKADSLTTLCSQAFTLLGSIETRKVFIASYSLSQFLQFGKPLLHPNELDQLLQAPSSTPTPTVPQADFAAFIRLLQTQTQENAREIVVLEGSSVSLFQEVFTYLGCGTMITSRPPNRARPAELSDVLAIAQLMKPYTLEGVLLPLSEDRIAQRVHEFLVYTVHDAVVGAARLTQFGSAGELGSICTLPRYRGKGLAKEIAQAIFVEAQKRGLRSVFSLSTSPQMWTFFEALGMTPVEREQLPEQWKSQYEFERPSRAYQKRI